MSSHDTHEPSQDKNLAPQNIKEMQVHAPPVNLHAVWNNFPPIAKLLIKATVLLSFAAGTFNWGVNMIDIGENAFAIFLLGLSFVPFAFFVKMWRGNPAHPRLTTWLKAAVYAATILLIAVFMGIAHNKAMSSSWSALLPKKGSNSPCLLRRLQTWQQ